MAFANPPAGRQGLPASMPEEVSSESGVNHRGQGGGHALLAVE